MSTSTTMIRVGALAALLGGLAVAAGAFGAHGLKAVLTPEALAWWKTGAEYHLVHALVLLVAALFAARDTAGAPTRTLKVALAALVAGIVLFSGSLYVMAATGVRALGAVTPFGGVALLVGWGALALDLWRRGRPPVS